MRITIGKAYVKPKHLEESDGKNQFDTGKDQCRSVRNSVGKERL